MASRYTLDPENIVHWHSGDMEEKWLWIGKEFRDLVRILRKLLWEERQADRGFYCNPCHSAEQAFKIQGGNAVR